MIAQNTVKVNGKWFYAGQEIDEVDFSTSDFSQHMNPPENDELPFVTVPNKQYTKTEINRMNTADLRKTALDVGIENAESMTGTELKKQLINAFNL